MVSYSFGVRDRNPACLDYHIHGEVTFQIADVFYLETVGLGTAGSERL